MVYGYYPEIVTHLGQEKELLKLELYQRSGFTQ
jgi:hypothetical protein